MNVIFMGTPEFAVPALLALIDSKKHIISAVFTQSPKAKNRGMKIVKSPVHELAEKNNIDVYTPKTLKNNEIDDLIQSIEADIIVVVAYGFIIPKNILSAKKYGCLNIHPSKLPKYRGAAPLQRTIINGEKESAVCVMQMDAGLDTGNILLQNTFPISDKITLAELHNYCAKMGGEMLIEVLDNINNIKPRKQSQENITYAYKLSKDESKINWHESAFAIDCKVRGMNPWPGVYFEYENKKIKLIKTSYINEKHIYEPGAILKQNSDYLEIATLDGILQISSLKPEGKNTMNAKDWYRGLRHLPEKL